MTQALINVLKADPMITWTNPADITFGAALGATQLNAGANVAGSFAYSPMSGTVLNAGASQTLDVTFTPTDTGNYNVVMAQALINVLKADPMITWANPADITSGTALSATQLNAGANVDGGFVYSPVSGTVLGVGNSQTLDATFTPDDTDNYNVVMAQALINVLAPPSDTQVSLDPSNNLVITDVASGGKNDSIRIFSDTGNSRFVITDPGAAFSTSVGSLADANTVHVPFTSVLGPKIIVEAGGGSDTLTVDYGMGAFSKDIDYRGGAGASDVLELDGGTTFASVDHVFTNQNEGWVDVFGNSRVSYTGLEPITDNLVADSRIFTFNASANQVSLTSDAALGFNVISSAASSETVTFPNTTSQLAIWTGDGNDTVTVHGVDEGLSGELRIEGQGGADTINISMTPISIGYLTLIAENLELGNGSITTSHTQTYTGVVTLMGDMDLNSGQDIVFGGPIDGDTAETRRLTLDCVGSTFMTHGVGTLNALSALITTAAGSIHLSGFITTSGSQLYNNAVVLATGPMGSTTAMTADLCAFNSTVNGTAPNAQSLTISSYPATFGGIIFGNGIGDDHVGGIDPLADLTTDSDGLVVFNATSITTDGHQTYNDHITVATSGTGNPVTTFNCGGNIGIFGWIDGNVPGAQSMIVNTPGGGSKTFGSPGAGHRIGDSAALDSLTTDSNGETFLNVSNVTTSGDQTYNANLILDTGTKTLTGANITFGAPVDASTTGSAGLLVNGSGTTLFMGAVGATTPLSVVITDAAGQTTFAGGTVTTTGNQSFFDPTILDGNTTFTGDNLTFAGALDASAPGGAGLVVNSSGSTTFDQPVGSADALSDLTTDATGQTVVSGGGVTTTGDQTFNDNMVISGNTVFYGDTITFESAVDGTSSEILSVNAETTIFNGRVGETTPPRDLRTDANGTTQINTDKMTASAVLRFNDSVIIGSTTTLSASSNGFYGPLDAAVAGNQSLIINSGGARFVDSVGGTAALANLTVNRGPGPNGNSVVITGPQIVTTGDQTYDVEVSIDTPAGTETTLTGVNVTFNDTINKPRHHQSRCEAHDQRQRRDHLW